MADLLDSCGHAYDTACLSIAPDDYDQDEHRVAIAAVFRTIAGEILEHHHRASARDIAQLLLDAAADAPKSEQEDEDPPETWATHPSLTPAERNPSLR